MQRLSHTVTTFYYSTFLWYFAINNILMQYSLIDNIRVHQFYKYISLYRCKNNNRNKKPLSTLEVKKFVEKTLQHHIAPKIKMHVKNRDRH